MGYVLDVVEVAFYGPSGTASVSDSAGNIYSALTAYPGASGTPGIRIFYSKMTNTSGNMTVTVHGSAIAACPMLIGGINGTLDSGSDNGAVSSNGTTCSPGNVNPGSGVHVLVTFEGGSVAVSSVPTPTIGNTGTGSYSVVSPVIAFAPGSHYGGGAGYLIQPSGTASNLTWNWPVASTSYCAEASFN
jgi:hypothetical protein